MSSDAERADALVAALLDVERYVGRFGWDQPARLFALVDSAAFARAEPTLAGQFGMTADDPDRLPHALTAIEQEDFADGNDLGETLAVISWPDSVDGCAVSLERTVLPPDAEADLPEDPDQAQAIATRHPQRRTLRLVVGALRGGERHGVGRLADGPDDLIGAPDLVPDLAAALQRTLA